MTKAKDGNSRAKPPKKKEKTAREKRLEEALKNNLSRRKTQPKSDK